MRLVIISNMAHYMQQGRIVGHGPTAREISYLSTLFDSVRHVGCLYPGDAPALMLPYATDRVTLVPLPPAGGVTLREKLSIIGHIPLYLSTIAKELRHADVVHVRCPANIPLLALILLALKRLPNKRWIKYAGNWNPEGKEALSYTFQRWWLRRDFAHAKVTVNGEWGNQPNHIHAFLNPCLTDEEVQEADGVASNRELTDPLRLLFVGNLNTPKGVGRALEILSHLHQQGIAATLDLIGDGNERTRFENQARELGIDSRVTFHGWIPRTSLGKYYATAHFLLFPSGSEGWPKVISEAMAYGVIPIAGAVSSIPQYLAQFGVGKALPPIAIEQFAEAIRDYTRNPECWRVESQRAKKTSEFFSYSRYLERVKVLLELS